jgi:hypothetical protein
MGSARVRNQLFRAIKQVPYQNVINTGMYAEKNHFFSRRRRIYKGLKQKHFYLGPTLTFNILKFASQLKTAGVPVVQAEVEAEALLEVFEANLSELVIKEGLRHEIKKLELRMTIKLV